MNKTTILEIIEKLTQRATTKSALALIIGAGGFATIARLAIAGNPAAIEILKTAFIAVLAYYFGQEAAKNKGVVS